MFSGYTASALAKMQYRNGIELPFRTLDFQLCVFICHQSMKTIEQSHCVKSALSYLGIQSSAGATPRAEELHNDQVLSSVT